MQSPIGHRTEGDAESGADSPGRPRRLGRLGRLRARAAAWFGAPGSQRRVLARNALWNWAAFVLHALTIYFLSPYIVHTLGTGPYGYWEAVIQLVGYLGLADLGIRPAIVHFVARHDALRQGAQVSRYVNTAFVWLAAGGVLVVAITAFIAPTAPHWFDVPASLHADTILATLIVGLTFAISLPLNAFSAVLIGKQRFDLSCKVDVFMTLARAAAVVIALSSGWGLVGLAASHALVTLSEMAWKTWLAFRVAPRLRFAPRRARATHARALLTFGGLNIIVALAMHLTYQTDALVIAACLSLEAVALFAFGAKLATYTRDMLFTVGRVLTPALGALEAVGKGNHAAIARLLVASTRGMLLVSVPLLLYWVVFGGAFLLAWLGDPAFRDEGSLPLLVLALGSLAPIASYPIVAAHWGTNRMRSLAVFSGIEGAGNLILSLSLVGPLGLAGVALGTAIPGFVVHGLLMPWWICREFDMHWGRWAAGALPVPLLAGGATAALFLGVVGRPQELGWIALICGGMALVAVYAIFGWAANRLLQPARNDDNVHRGSAPAETP